MFFLAKAHGAVTALALSHDHTFIAVGHIFGHIQLFDLENPATPVRAVLPTNSGAISSGQREGHLQGSRIVNLDFIAGRHTAIVSADNKGLAFYHSLGKVLFVEASDTVRLLGRYDDTSLVKDSTPAIFRKRARTTTSILAMAPLPLGTITHPTDDYQVIAILTHAKLVIVGLKPTGRTWLKRHRKVSDSNRLRDASGSLAWWPSTSTSSAKLNSPFQPKVSESRVDDPQLVYAWGCTCYLLRISETKTKQKFGNRRTGRSVERDVGALSFREIGSWDVQEDVQALQWLNLNVGTIINICCSMLTKLHM